MIKRYENQLLREHIAQYCCGITLLHFSHASAVSYIRERRGWGCSGSYSCRCSDKNVRMMIGMRGRMNLAACLLVGGRSGGLDPIELGLLVEGWLSLDWKRPQIDGGCDYYSGRKVMARSELCESLVRRAATPACSENVFFMLTSRGQGCVPSEGEPHLASGAVMGTNPFLSYLPGFCVCKNRLRSSVAIRFFT